ncbi:histidine phosphatase superfamily [Limtongia smithiae]|uniref:histidine phosphatase superfamily n=1 Tax=Limtongia smithiae TaxID=1125753 RepID=UPI0034CE9C03
MAEPEYPETLVLRQVQLLFRHGERTPVHRSLQQWDKWGFPVFWPLCDSARFSMAGVVNPRVGHVTSFPYEREIETETSASPFSKLFTNAGASGLCLEGQLTDKGRLSGFKLGEHLRALYIDKLAFLPREFTDQSDVYLRSTYVLRSLETMYELFAGLYPFTANTVVVPKIHERFTFEETLYPPHRCARLQELRVAFVAAAAEKWDPILAAHPTAALQHLLTSPNATISVRDEARDNAWALLDTYASAHAHRVTTPPAFADPKVSNILARAAIESEFAGYARNPEMRTLGMGRFFAEVLTRMTIGDIVRSQNDGEIDKMLSRTPGKVVYRKIPKLALYAAHDSSVGAILETLGAFDRKWINFTSHITFEQFEERAAKKQQYVRVLHNGRPLALPFCAPAEAHRGEDVEMCTMAAFTKFVQSVTPADHAAECRANLGTPVPVEQLTGYGPVSGV